MRHEGVDLPPHALEHPREHRRSALAVHVVVAVHEHRDARAHRARDQRDRARHVGPGERIAEALELGPQERLGALRRGEAALHQDGGEGLGDVEVGGQGGRYVRVRGRRDGPAGGNHSPA